MTPEALQDVGCQIQPLLGGGMQDFDGGIVGHLNFFALSGASRPYIGRSSAVEAHAFLEPALRVRAEKHGPPLSEVLLIPHPGVKIGIEDICQKVTEDDECCTDDEDCH